MSSLSQAEDSSHSALKTWGCSSQDATQQHRPSAPCASSLRIGATSPQAPAPPTTPQPPAWVMGMLSTQFFGPCEAHKHLKKNECTLFCTTCTHGPGLCQHCLGSHRGHTVMQIRRYVYCDVVRNQDINPYVNTDGIQSYIINQSKVVFLNARPQTKVGAASDADTCAHCRRTLREGCRYCCLACKVEVEANGSGLHSARSSPSTLLVSPSGSQAIPGRQAPSSARPRAAAIRRRSDPGHPRPQPPPAQATEQVGQQQQGLVPAALAGAVPGAVCLVGEASGPCGPLAEEEVCLYGSGSNQSSSWREQAAAAEGSGRPAAGSSGRCWEEVEHAAGGCSVHGDVGVKAGCKRQRSTTTRCGRSVRPTSWRTAEGLGDDAAAPAMRRSGPVDQPQAWQARQGPGLDVCWEAKGGEADASKLGGRPEPSAAGVQRPLCNSHSSDLDESSFFLADAEPVQERGGASMLSAPAQQCVQRASGAGRRKQGAPQRSHPV